VKLNPRSSRSSIVESMRHIARANVARVQQRCDIDIASDIVDDVDVDIASDVDDREGKPIGW